ncbi:MAG: hypothetical protein KZQ63_06530 [Candidatus Thiodiazotropha sp. (ex Lucinoma aequizonata)]|nr:hypothetical protein [Candidatus Thiodiazotropha sp. (ex Lucinoma aequizonata)]
METVSGFDAQPFTLFAVLVSAPESEIDEWKAELQRMIDQRNLVVFDVRPLGKRYKLLEGD